MRKLKVELSSVGNPDFGQDPDRPLYGAKKNKKVSVSSFEEASEVVNKFIHENDLGSGNWSGGAIFENGKQIAHVSYNGRVWEGTEWNTNGKEIILTK